MTEIGSVQLFWVDIEDGSGNRYGNGPLRPNGFTTTSLLSASGEFSFDVSAADPNLATLAEKRTAICRYAIDGTVQVFGGGVIDKIDLQIDTGQLIYTVSGNDLGRELSYRSVGQLNLECGGTAGIG